MEVITRASAKAFNLNRYFTNKPCPQGHTCERRTADKHCVQCTRNREHGKDERDPARKVRRSANQYKRRRDNGTLWRTRNPEHHKEILVRGNLRRKFRLTLEQYNALLDRQGGKCMICSKTEWRALAVDHCHKTDRLRGLLCSVCNKNLGIYEANKEAFAAYLTLTDSVKHAKMLAKIIKAAQ